ncbi:MAG: hypothetical protein EOM54_01655 [Clostridia bacterium]|nr:hypothetical protein [Clostridia bacterium]
MAANLPYLAAPGSITTALTKIRSAATPERVTTDFVTTKLMMKGGTGAAIPPFLKKINFVASDGTPTELYKVFRNPNTGGRAVADAIKFGYQPLLEANEYFYELPDNELLALILQITGLESKNKVAKYILSTLNNLKSFASFDEEPAENKADDGNDEHEKPQEKSDRDNKEKSDSDDRINLTYTINLNLPATSDQAVFNAIFKSLKEHLLSNE